MARFERQVSWLPLVAPTAELESVPFESNTTFDSIWHPKSSLPFLPTLPETPPGSFADDQQPPMTIDSIVDHRHSYMLLSPPLVPRKSQLCTAKDTVDAFVSSDESIGADAIEITQPIAGEELASDLAIAVRIIATIAEAHEIFDEHARVGTDSHRCFSVSSIPRFLLPYSLFSLAGF